MSKLSSVILNFGDESIIVNVATKTFKMNLEEVVDPEFLTLPPLYVIAKTGKTKVWKVWVQSDSVNRTYGDVDGKLVTTTRKCKATNVGRKNATTAQEQACLQAERDWISQLDKGYMPSKDDKSGMDKYQEVMKSKGKQGGGNHGLVIAKGQTAGKKVKEDNLRVDEIEDELLPMHAEKFTTEKKCLKYFDFDNGVYIQPKFDGWRMVARSQTSEDDKKHVVLTTRNGKQYPWFVKIRQELLKIFQNHEIVLDGEVYAHKLVDEKGVDVPEAEKFQIISSAGGVARKAPHELEDQLCFYVFDAVDASGTLNQDERFKLLKKALDDYTKNGGVTIKMADTRTVNYLEDVFDWHDRYVQQGYEGIIIRDRDLIYSLKHRSQKLRKYKNFIDKECPIVGAKTGEGTEEGCVVWICKFENNKTFDVRPRGTFEERKKLFNERNLYIGRPLTVRYQQLSNDGVPRFPVGISIREEFEK